MKAKKIKVLAATRGFFGRRKNCFTVAIRAAHRAWAKAYEGRKHKKRAFRELWIAKIGAAARQHGLVYSALMRAMPLTGMALNRKSLADLAVTEPYSFLAVVEAAKRVLPPPPAPAPKAVELK